MVTPLPKVNSNPLAAIQAFTQPRRNQLAGLASGLLSGNDWGQGLSAGFAQAAQGRQVDDAYAVSQKEAAQRQEQLAKTISYLRTQPGGSPWADAVENGLADPKDAFKSWYEATKSVDTADNAPANVQEWKYFSTLTPEQQSQYLTMKRSVPFLDQGTQFGRPDPVTGVVGPVVPKENFQESFEKASGTATGKATAEGQIGAPAAITSAETSLAQIDAVINDPNLKYAIGLGGLLPPIAGTPQAGTVARIEQLQGTAFLQAFESLKGGGQITEVEGKKATDAIARLSRAQNETDFKQALEELKSVIKIGLERAKSKLPQAGGGAVNQDVEDILKGFGL